MRKHEIRVAKPGTSVPVEEQFTYRLAEAALNAAPLERDIVDTVVDRVVDSVAGAVAALTQPPAARAQSQAKAHQRPGGATLLGAAPDVTVHAEWAAYANTTAVRDLDWSDTAGGVDYAHPSDCIGTMIAVGQQAGRSGHDIVTGIAHSYEVMVALTGSIPLHTYGVDQFASFGAAVSTGLCAMLRLPVEVASRAIALTAYLTATTYQIRQGKVSSWKANGPGFCGMTAIHAVDRAMRGEDSPSPVYEGAYGELAVMLGGPDATFAVPLLEKGEHPRLILQESFPKQWPVEYLAQAFVDMAVRLKPKVPDTSEVSSIVLTGSDDMQGIIGSSEPERYDPDAPRGTLDHSLMFLFAVALQDGTIDFRESFATDRVHRADTVALWHKITTQPAEKWSRGVAAASLADKMTGGSVEITLDDGTVLTDELANPLAYPYPTPWRRVDYIGKFTTVTDSLLADGESDRFLALVQDLPDLSGDQLNGIYPAVADGVIPDGGSGLF